jgi:hypothetical protein
MWSHLVLFQDHKPFVTWDFGLLIEDVPTSVCRSRSGESVRESDRRGWQCYVTTNSTLRGRPTPSQNRLEWGTRPLLRRAVGWATRPRLPGCYSSWPGFFDRTSDAKSSIALSARAFCGDNSLTITRSAFSLLTFNFCNWACGLSASESGSMVIASVSSCFDNSPWFAKNSTRFMSCSENSPNAISASSRFPPPSLLWCFVRYSAAHRFPCLTS